VIGDWKSLGACTWESTEASSVTIIEEEQAIDDHRALIADPARA
jgi:hypothetical protein